MSGWPGDAACQCSPCQHCFIGRHGRCRFNRHPEPVLYPHTYVTDKHGMVVGDGQRDVWLVGHTCAWVCDCFRRGHGLHGVQLSLFADAL